ncbi:GAF domain-containing protein [Candidatus Cyanaurora vandensis]|uniref:GAF domain-containing protein n=1 Tax=Candidatus Cyanaurora vandensis TaxID=2714958 RepID=UPI00257CF927|nr:GAF domain-containing protein [Candidatus Cyanaurora vandensis]
MTIAYPNERPLDRTVPSDNTAVVKQITKRTNFLKSLLADGEDEASRYVLKMVQQIESLTDLLEERDRKASPNDDRYRLERDLLLSIIAKIRESLDLQTIFETTVTEVRQLIGADRMVVYQFDQDFLGTVVAESVGTGWTKSLGVPIIDTCFKESRGSGKSGYENGRIIPTDDIYKAGLTPCHLKMLEQFEVKSNLVVPILQEERVWGLLIAHQCAATRHWAETEVSLLYQIALQLKVAIQQAESVLQQQQKAKQERDRLFAITNKIRASLDLQTIFDTAVTEVRQYLQTDRMVVYKFDENFMGTVVAESVGAKWTVSLGLPIVDTCFKETKAVQYAQGRIVPTEDIRNAGLTACHIKMLERFEVKANLVVPILQEGGAVWGLFIAHQCDRTRAWTESEINVLYQIATQLTVGIQQAESVLQQQVKARQERDQVLALTTKIRESLDLQTIFNTAVQELRVFLGADRMVVYRFDPDFIGTVVAEAVLPGWTPSLGLAIVDTCFKETKAVQYAQGRIVPTEDIQNAGLTACHIQMLERFQVKANLVVPILQEGMVWGLFIAHQCSHTRAWLESEINLLYQVATQLTIAIQQAESVVKAQQKAREERDQLLSVIAKVQQAQNTDAYYAQITQEARVLLGADRVAIYRFNPDWGGEFMAESFGAGCKPLVGTARARVDDSYLQANGGGRYREDEHQVVDDIYKMGFDSCHTELLEQFQARAYVIVPIFQNRKLWGLLAAYQNSGPRRWEKYEITQLRQYASQLADTVYRTATIEARNLLQCDRVALFRFDPDFSGEFVMESVSEGWLPLVGTERARVTDSYLTKNDGGRYRNNESQTVNDIYTTGFDSCHISLLERFQARAYIIVPVFQDQKLWGLFAAYQNSGPRLWSESEVNLLYQVAIQITVGQQQAEALEKARLLAEAAKREQQARENEARQQQEFARQQQGAKEQLQRRILELMMEVDPVSKGDLTIRARVDEDEIGTLADSYNATISSLRKIVVQVQQATRQMTGTATQSTTEVTGLALASLQQAEELTLALGRVEQMDSSIQQVSQSARAAEAAVQQANRTLAAGDQAMDRTVDGILVIRETVAETAKKIKRLSESSQKISKVVSLIASFAAQTNLLALNAAIEAARAGEQGRGFAVVADEVRSLARQSAQATAEIEKLVEGIQQETREVALAMESGTEQVVAGTKLVNETRQSLTQIAQVSGEISRLVQTIAQSSYTQAEASESITQVMKDVAQSAQATAGGANQTTISFKLLLEVAQQLEVSVGKFKVN